MNDNPLGVNIREMTGKIFFILSVSTDPASTIMLESYLISLVWASLHKVGAHQYDTDLKDCRRNWKAAKNRYTSGIIGWSSCQDILSDIQDFLFDVAIEQDIIIIKAEWYNLSAGADLPNQPKIDPSSILDAIRGVT